MLGEPDEIQSEPVEPRNLVENRRIKRRVVDSRIGRIAKVVSNAEAQRVSHRSSLEFPVRNDAISRAACPASALQTHCRTAIVWTR